MFAKGSFVTFAAVVCAAMGARSLAVGPTWNVDLLNSTLTMSTSTYADNGANGSKPGGIWDEDSNTAGVFQSNFVLGVETYDFGAGIDVASRDNDNSVPFSTSASSVAVVTIDGVGSNTLEVYWRTNTLNDNFDGDGFIAESLGDLLASIRATIEGVAPGTPVTVDYDWDYFGAAETLHEAFNEDPESADGGLGLLADTGDGPGIVFAAVFDSQDAATDTGTDADSGFFNLTTSNPESYVGIAIDSTSMARTQSPGVAPNDEDLGGSEFIGRVTLVVTPEPSAVMVGLMMAGLLTIRKPR